MKAVSKVLSDVQGSLIFGQILQLLHHILQYISNLAFNSLICLISAQNILKCFSLFQLIKNVHKQDEALLRIPAFERAVSRVLRDIKVVRRYVY